MSALRDNVTDFPYPQIKIIKHLVAQMKVVPLVFDNHAVVSKFCEALVALLELLLDPKSSIEDANAKATALVDLLMFPEIRAEAEASIAKSLELEEANTALIAQLAQVRDELASAQCENAELKQQIAATPRLSPNQVGSVTTLVSGLARQIDERTRRDANTIDAIDKLARLNEQQLARFNEEIADLNAYKTLSVQILSAISPTIPQDPAATGLDTQAVNSELARRQEWDNAADQLIEAASEEIENAESTIVSIDEQIKFVDEEDAAGLKRQKREHLSRLSTLRNYIKQILTIRSGIRTETEKLQQLLEAEALVGTGLDPKLVQADEPHFPAYPETDEAEDVSEEPEATTDTSNVDKALNERMSQLNEIASKVGLPANLIVFITIYECIPGIDKTPRGWITVAKKALKSGLIRNFGFIKSQKDLRVGWHIRNAGDPALKYLLYSGTFGPQQMMRRTPDLLPWSVSDLFSAEEIARFQEEFKSSAQAKKISV